MSPLRIGIGVSNFLVAFVSTTYWLNSSLPNLDKGLAIVLTALVSISWHSFLYIRVGRAENDRH